MQAILATIRILVAQLQAGHLVDLLSQRHHAPYLTRHRLEAVVVRIRLVAVAFSVLTLVWIGFDVATLERSQWLPLLMFRLVAFAAFLALAVVPDRIRTRPAVLWMLAVTLALPMMLYVVAQFILGDSHLEGLAAINGRLYEALPFIVLAGLSIFPLVVLEGLLFAVSILLLVSIVQVASVGLDAVQLFSTLWVLALALGIYLLASAIQLHYMMALLRRASYDPLTGALTRRSGGEVIDLHFRLACEQGTPLAIAFLDLDNFKGINDQYGHEAGDQALRGVVTALAHSLRKADAVIRWGGEEFVVLMTNTGIEGVRIAMARLFDEWLGLRPDGMPLTASIGVSERITDAVVDWSQLIKLADERMYGAKESGKARCILNDGEVLVPSQSGEKQNELEP